MACILHIETSTTVCSVALSLDGNLLFDRVHREGPSHAAVLAPFVEEGLAYLRSEGLHLDAVAVSSGPGSYTGLRIGVSTAKGLCYALDVPLIAIGTLEVMASQAVDAGLCGEGDLLCPMIDARRMEVYAAVYDTKLQPVRITQADIVDEATYLPYLEGGRVLFFGNGAPKCRTSIGHAHAVFAEGIEPLASSMIALAERAWMEKRFEDVAYFEPFYLKEFVATQAKNKVLTPQ
ncbi:MAG: tRNA (adenosine(37)-N6)-threonylcarbamoyltransferase complex dimerization subunit type 1 TsaB [Bacteroidales bacterium]|nr:tRNA (adenosine(37)-N6)-threonylcarbamoyltransferase complex dimerization subunit type 1 TsaB [Bacteroidales bacterium]